ncbi:hypothetical protein KBT16_06860 [Nostoc sp. CCCryo 231-06]|nr:hypothetical protein [Nostoc sp. CCCryo 231-06]
MSTTGYAYAHFPQPEKFTLFWVNMRSLFKSKPGYITQTQFRRKLLTNQYSLRSLLNEQFHIYMYFVW